MEEEKECSACGEIKPLSRFHRKERSKFGRASRCADCVNTAIKILRKARKASNNFVKITEKRCSRCRETKLVKHFCFTGYSRDGYDSYCRPYRVYMNRQRYSS